MATENWFRMGQKIQLIENNIQKLKVECAPYAERLQGFGTTFLEELHEYETALKFLSGAQLTAEDFQILKNIQFINFLGGSHLEHDLSPEYGEVNPELAHWQFDEFWLNLALEWTNSYLNLCRGYTRGISTVQQAFLARRFAPGGALYQPAAERFARGAEAYQQL